MRTSGEHYAVAVGDLTRVLQQIRPDRLVAPKRLNHRTVLLHCPETLSAPKRFVGIFPTSINHASVVEHRGRVLRFAAARQDIEILVARLDIERHPRHDVSVSRRHATHINMPASGEKHDIFPVGEVNRVKIVENTGGQLPQIFSVDVGFIYMEVFFVMRFEGKEDSLAVEREIGSPEMSVQRFLRHDLRHFPVGIQPFLNNEPSAHHAHVTEPVAGFVIKLRAPRVRVVDVHYRVEIDRRIAEHYFALDVAHSKIEFRIERLHVQRRRLRLQLVEPAAEPFRQVSVEREPRQQFASPANFERRTGDVGLIIALEKPVVFDHLTGIGGGTVASLRRLKFDARRHRFPISRTFINKIFHFVEQSCQRRLVCVDSERIAQLHKMRFQPFHPLPLFVVGGREHAPLQRRQRQIFEGVLCQPVGERTPFFGIQSDIINRIFIPSHCIFVCPVGKIFLQQPFEFDSIQFVNFSVGILYILIDFVERFDERFCLDIIGDSLFARQFEGIRQRLFPFRVKSSKLLPVERLGIERNLVDTSVEKLRLAIERANEQRRIIAVFESGTDSGLPSKRGDFASVEIDMHPFAVERSARQMPATVAEFGARNGGVALGIVSAAIDAERQVLSFAQGQRHTPCAHVILSGVLADNDRIVCNRIWGNPRHERELGESAFGQNLGCDFNHRLFVGTEFDGFAHDSGNGRRFFVDFGI